MSCNGWKHLKNYRLNDDFCARNIEMRDASRKKTGSSHQRVWRMFKNYSLTIVRLSEYNHAETI